MARVSNPANQDNQETAPRLVNYLIKHHHWSPFEMVNACVEVETTRDVGRQLLRHRSFTFQEFSGRYAAYEEVLTEREYRKQDVKNRQNSLEVETPEWWAQLVKTWALDAQDLYEGLLSDGVAKEVARAVLPEGFVPTKMYANNTIRGWLHYFDVRCHEHTQKEHRLLAESCKEVILSQLPIIREAYEQSKQN